MAKILISEDEKDIRELIAFTLRFDGHEVISTSNGEEACQAALREIPDLILLDVRMPRMGGYQACEMIKANQSTQNIPVVFLSAKGQESEVRSGFEAGADEYILKPFSPEQLNDQIKAILKKSEKPA